ncbi:MAG: hypothetical protein FJ271_13925 [Planctomycetes bacterium]|nr:hypothetical protein [Planctomycetota bacterium]
MDKQPSKGRETFLAIFLIIVFGGAFALFLDLISMGLLSAIVKITLLITVLGALQYLIWGYWLTREVAGEREELELREKMQADGESWENRP